MNLQKNEKIEMMNLTCRHMFYWKSSSLVLFIASYYLVEICRIAPNCIEGFQLNENSMLSRSMSRANRWNEHGWTKEKSLERGSGWISLSSLKGSSKGSSNDDSSNNNNDLSFNMESLQSRILELKERSNKMPLVVLDAMLPRQVLKVNVRNALLMELIRTKLEAEDPFFGMLGTARIATAGGGSPQLINLVHGVQVQILTPPKDEINKNIPDDAFRLHIRATEKRFVIDGEIESTEQGWTEADVKFLDSKEENDEDGYDDAVELAKEFTLDNGKNSNLVDTWIQLARDRERQSGQIEQLLLDLGPIPSHEDPTDLAFWIGALINPLPAMGVATEIRPALLTAPDVEKRIKIAHDGIIKSINHMDGTSPLF